MSQESVLFDGERIKSSLQESPSPLWEGVPDVSRDGEREGIKRALI